MKNLITVIATSIVSVLTFGQNLEIYTFESQTMGNVNLSGTEFPISITNDGHYTYHFYIKNTSSTPKEVYVERTIVLEPVNWEDWLSWARALTEEDVLFQNSCYSSTTMNSNIWTTQNFITVPAGMGAELIPEYYISGPGNACYKYTFIENSNRIDSLTVCLSQVASNKEYSASEISLFPNPVLNTITISNYQLSSSTTIQINDLLGNSILESKLNNENTIDLSQLKNGSYLLTISENGLPVLKRTILKTH